MRTFQIRFYSARPKHRLDRAMQWALRDKLIHCAVYDPLNNIIINPAKGGHISTKHPYLRSATVYCDDFPVPQKYNLISTAIQYFNPLRKSFKGGTMNCVTYINNHLFNNTPLEGKRPVDVYQRILRES